MTDQAQLTAVHPGEILLEEFLKPLGLSQNRLALDIRVPARRINEIVLGRRAVTANTALRLSRYFDTTPQFWLGLQADYDLDIEADALGARLDQEVRARTSQAGECAVGHDGDDGRAGVKWRSSGNASS